MKTISKFELKKSSTTFEKVKITSSIDAQNYIRQFYFDDIEIYESCFILLLNRNNQTIGYAKISQGGITGTIVDAKIICKYAVDSLASGVILAHNHPSGNLNPSQGDKDMTNKIKDALKLLDTSLFDHVILTSEGYYSFMENGYL
jgi:DNA repair protein RadC